MIQDIQKQYRDDRRKKLEKTTLPVFKEIRPVTQNCIVAVHGEAARIPPLRAEDKFVTDGAVKAELFATHFRSKMSLPVDEDYQPRPDVSHVTNLGSRHPAQGSSEDTQNSRPLQSRRSVSD